MAGTWGRRFAVDALLWGFLLWLLGFAVGMLAFLVVEPRWIGFVVLPILLPVTAWVAWRRLSGRHWPTAYPAAVGAVWCALAIALDWAVLVRGFTVDAYYDADIFAYYALAFLTPVVVGVWTRRRTTALQERP